MIEYFGLRYRAQYLEWRSSSRCPKATLPPWGKAAVVEDEAEPDVTSVLGLRPMTVPFSLLRLRDKIQERQNMHMSRMYQKI